MATVKRIVCLANSRKRRGRCVAGKEKSGLWIRPVSDREHEEVSFEERHYENGSEPKVLDIVDVPLLAAKPKDFQQENWLIDPRQYWSLAGTASWSDLLGIADPEGPLWIDGHSTYHGSNDKIPLSLSTFVRSSLRLLHVDSMTIAVFVPGRAFGDLKRRVQGCFRHAGVEYRLWVTDPTYEARFRALPDGEHALGECFLTISLGEPFGDDCNKLIAAIIERTGLGAT